MASQEPDDNLCQQCGARLARDRRYCIHCYAPVGVTASRAHVDLVRETATTHRPDPTFVFSPEKHEAIARRNRSRKRIAIIGAATLILSIASLVVLSSLSRSRKELQRRVAREQAAKKELNTLAEALERFKADVERYPTNEEGLRCLSRKPAAFAAVTGDRMNYWFGPYLENVPEVDPWGNDYVYHTADGGRSFELFSLGPGGGGGNGNQFRVTSPASASQVGSPG